MSNLININGVSVAAPTTFEVNNLPISNNPERNAQGDMLIDLVTRKIKVIVEWTNIPEAEVAKIERAIEPFIFNITYHHAGKGKKTILVYHGDLTYSMKFYKQGNPIYGSVKVNFIQI